MKKENFGIVSSKQNPSQANTSQYILLTTYSFDSSMPVLLFDSFSKAEKEMKRQVEEEIRIAVEENGNLRENIEQETSFNGVILTEWAHLSSRRDITEWKILPVQNH